MSLHVDVHRRGPHAGFHINYPMGLPLAKYDKGWRSKGHLRSLASYIAQVIGGLSNR